LLLDLANACIDREVIKYGRIQKNLQSGAISDLNPNPFFTPPDINATDFNTIQNELKYKNTPISDDK